MLVQVVIVCIPGRVSSTTATFVNTNVWSNAIVSHGYISRVLLIHRFCSCCDEKSRL